MKKVLVLLLSFFMVGCASNGSASVMDADLPAYEISGQAVLTLTSETPMTSVLIDVREDVELSQTGIIPGALHIPLGSLTQESLTRAGVAPDDTVVVYCRSGNRSKTAYQILTDLGYGNVKSLHGGMNLWLADGNPVVPQ